MGTSTSWAKRAATCGLAVTCLSGPAAAETSTPLQAEGFIAANVVGAFYHELGHAVIDIQNVPVFGQEEDAADVFSIILIDSLYEDEDAEAIAFDVALQFWAEAGVRAEDGEQTEWWSVHGQDEQRFYNATCLFYGADPQRREQFAIDMELPEDRAETCPDEYQLALDSWGPVLDDMEALRSQGSMTLTVAPDARGLAPVTADVLREEVAALNETFGLERDLSIRIETCGEANAFYDLDETAIIMCAEYETWFAELYANLD